MAITDMDLIEGREARAAVRRAVAKTREAIVLNYERKRKKLKRWFGKYIVF